MLLVIWIFSIFTGALSEMVFLPESSDHYEIKEHVILTGGFLEYDGDYELPLNKVGKVWVNNNKIIPEKANGIEKDYDYFLSAMPKREKKQLIEMNSTKIDQTTEKMDIVKEYIAGLNTNHTYNYKEKKEDSFLDWLLQPIAIEKCANDAGIGLTAIRCMKSTQGSQQANITTKFFLYWLLIDLAILCILWCTKGWCCCCCPFPFCKINRRIQETQNYLAINPPGEWTDDKGKHYNYDATPEEKLIYENMSRSFMVL